MSYILKQMPVPADQKNHPNKNLTAINYITIHNTGNYDATATAESHAVYQYNGSGGREVSWHYTVDEKEIYQSFFDNRMCWHCGSLKGNSESLSIEICVNNKDKYKTACDNAAQLTADLMFKHKLTKDRLLQHNYWSGKDCPKELRSGEWGISWAEFTALADQYYKAKIQANTNTGGSSMKNGDRNIGIYAYKRILTILGYQVDDNDMFGNGTESATKGIQKAANLPQTGIADQATVKAAYNQVLSKISNDRMNLVNENNGYKTRLSQINNLSKL